MLSTLGLSSGSNSPDLGPMFQVQTYSLCSKYHHCLLIRTHWDQFLICWDLQNSWRETANSLKSIHNKWHSNITVGFLCPFFVSDNVQSFTPWSINFFSSTSSPFAKIEGGKGNTTYGKEEDSHWGIPTVQSAVLFLSEEMVKENYSSGALEACTLI